MTKTKQLSALLLSLPFVFSLSACGKAEGEECKPVMLFENDYSHTPNREFSLERKREEEDFTCCFESTLKQTTLEHGIQSLSYAAEFHSLPETIYFLEKSATCVGKDALWVDPSDPPELILSVLLESDAKNRLPFGIFAGVSAALLEDRAEFSLCEGERLAKNMREFSFVTDLQYPLYTSFGAKRELRNTAWSYALRLGKLFLGEHSVEELKTADEEDIFPTLSAVGAAHPDFYCPVGDVCYPLKANTQTFNFCFDPAFEETTLSKGDFSVNYLSAKSFILETERLFAKNKEIFAPFAPKEEEEDTSFEEEKKIDIFIGNFGLSATGWIDYRQNAILLESVSAATFYTTEILLYQTVGLREMQYPICDYFNLESTYGKAALFALYRGKLAGNSYDKKALSAARRLYRRAFKRARNADEFRPYEFLDCLSCALNESLNNKIGYIAQLSSLLGYAYEHYGIELVLDLDRDRRLDNGKTEEFIEEWMTHLKETYE